MTNLEYVKELQSLVGDINFLLEKNNISEKISLSDIIVTDKTVSDLVKQDEKLSELIINLLWPSISSATVYHYTSKCAAESILNSGFFRLTNIEKRYTEGEIVTFCETHKLDGYLKKDENGIPTYRHLIMPNTFYASFTDANLSEVQEEYFWSAFAAHDGVRLKIEVEALNPNFRKIHYEVRKGLPIPLIDELTKCVREKYNREFILKGISRLCSFYLSDADYGQENEYRALYRTWDGSGPQPKGVGPSSYVELPLNEMSECGYKLTVTEVHAKERIIMPSSYKFSQRGA